MTAAERRDIEPGTIVDGRYEIERLVDGKGAGAVFRALDRQTGTPVALKLFRRLPIRKGAGELFLREAQALVELRHPGIAAHFGYGFIEEQAFLVMEWLAGESLAERLRRQPLRLGESLALVRQVADALGELHRRGLVHRDVRPHKLLLREGRIEGVTLLSGGFVFSHVSMRTMTTSGELAALLRYVAPELARGGARPGPGADVFALGCVLFECLLGVTPFADENAAVILARLLYEEVPRLDRLRPELPEGLGELLGRMLDKHPGRRIRDATVLGEGLARLVVTPAQAEMVPPAPPPGLEKHEQQMVSLLLVAVPQDEVAEERDGAAPAEAVGVAVPGSELAAWLASYSAAGEPLADGSLIVTVEEKGQTAIDRAVQVARVAQALRERLPHWSMAVATGRGQEAGARLAGEALGLAVAMLASRASQVSGGHGGTVAHEVVGEGSEERVGGAGPIWLDELTAGLLDTRFQVERLAEGAALGRERMAGDEQRSLLGQMTPFVGRDQELRLLTAVMAGAIAEPEARAMLVLAPSGTGKSRLRQEFVRRLEANEEEVVVLLGRGDSLRTDKPYGLVGAMLLDLCGLSGVAGLRERQEGLARRVGRYLGQAERRSVVEFLGELCSIPFPDEGNPPLRAARQDPRLMNDHLMDACLAFLRAECAAHPVLLVLEDLHWGDAATVRLVDTALRELAERPLMVLALARPEVRERFPRLWVERNVHEVHLGGLNRRASERLAQVVLGERAQPALVERIAEQAGGNALFLEELIRAAAEAGEVHGGAVAPATVLAMLEARFLRLPSEVRRVLRAASILGETFWRGGVSALLGGGREGGGRETDQVVEQGLEALMAAEVVVRQGQGRFAGEVQFAFRHALMRDAAYGLLTEEDRRLGHCLAGAYLERMGERDATVLAEHWRLGGEGARAAALFAEAADEALASSDLAGALRCAEQGMACGASGELLGTLQTLAAWAHFWASDFAATVALGRSAMALLPPGSGSWYRVMGLFMVMTSEPEALRQLVRTFIEAEPQPGAERAFVVPAVGANMQISLGGMRELSRALGARLKEFGGWLGGEDNVHVQGMIHATLIWEPLLFEGDLWQFRSACWSSVDRLMQAGDRRFVATMRAHLGFVEALLGDAAAGLAMLRTQLAELARMGEMFLRGCFLAEGAVALVESGELGEARAIAEELLAGPMTGFWRVLGQSALAGALLGLGELGEAEAVARQALDAMALTPVGIPLAAAVLGRCLMVQGRVAEARAMAEAGLVSLGALGGMGFMDVKLLLVAAEARRAIGEVDAARAALAMAAERIERRAAGIPEVSWRERFEQRPDHVRVRSLLR